MRTPPPDLTHIAQRRGGQFPDAEIAAQIDGRAMVRADLATSGVMFSLDTETGFRGVVLINAAYGLGENVGRVEPPCGQ